MRAKILPTKLAMIIWINILLCCAWLADSRDHKCVMFDFQHLWFFFRQRTGNTGGPSAPRANFVMVVRLAVGFVIFFFLEGKHRMDKIEFYKKVQYSVNRSHFFSSFSLTYFTCPPFVLFSMQFLFSLATQSQLFHFTPIAFFVKRWFRDKSFDNQNDPKTFRAVCFVPRGWIEHPTPTSSKVNLDYLISHRKGAGR